MLKMSFFTYGSFLMEDGSDLVIASRSFSVTASLFGNVILSFFFFFLFFCKVLTICCLSYVIVKCSQFWYSLQYKLLLFCMGCFQVFAKSHRTVAV